MCHHVYKKMWMPFIGEKLHTTLRTNILSQFFKKEIRLGHLPLGKSERFAKAIFLLSKSS